MVEEKVLDFPTENIFTFKGIESAEALSPESGVIFDFTNPVDYGELINNIKFDPPLEVPEYYVQFGAAYSLDFYLPLLAQTEYKVKISKGIKDLFGNTLEKDIETSFKTTDYSPSIFIEGGYGAVESNSPRTFPVSFMNIDKVKLQMGIFSKEDIIPFLTRDYYSEYIPENKDYLVVDRLWEPDLPKNSSYWLPVKLDEALKGKKTGFVYLDIIPKEPWLDESSETFLQVTNLGITGKFSQDNNYIYVHTLDTAEPVPGADIELRDAGNKVLWTGKTDEEGKVETPGWGKLGLKLDENRLWVFASQGEDICVAASSGLCSIPLYAFGIYSYQPYEREFNAFLFTEKGVYRGGETVHIKGTFREKIGGKWEISSEKVLNFRIYDSRDNQVYKKNVNLSGYGSFNCDFTLPEDSYTGRYTLDLRGEIDGEDYSFCYDDFLVEDYKAAQFEVTVKSDKDYYALGDTFTGNVFGWYLFGSPMKGDTVNWYTNLEPSWYSPPGYEEFDFGKDYFEWYDDRDSIYLGSGQGVLGDNGKFPLSFEIVDEKNRAPYVLTVQGEVQSVSRQSISGYKEIMIHPGEFYTGIKPGSRFITSGEAEKFQIITVTPDGKILEGQDIKVDILNRYWNSVRKEGMNGKTEWTTEEVDEVVKTFDVKSVKEPASLEFFPEKSGLYIIRAQGKDKNDNNIVTESYFYVSGKDYVAWARYNDDSIDLVADKREYNPGDTARILVKSPYEKARALVTVEREHILKSFFVDVSGTADTIEVPIEKDYLPNVYISVILYQGRVSDNSYSDTGEDLGKPSFKIGYINLPVIPDDKKLVVKVETDKDKYEPGDDVRVKVHLADSEGKGVMGEVALWAVDVGVLNLTAFKTPDYFNSFYGERGLFVRTCENRLKIIGQRNFGQKGGNPGGDGAMPSVSPRENFVATPYFNPSVITDEKGDAVIKFTLPDNITTFLIMAVGQTKDSSFGSAEKRILATKPLLLKSSMPSFVRLYDKFKAGVVVFNGTDKEGEITVTLENKGFTLLDDKERKITIPPGQEEEVLFSFEAPQVCEGELVISALMEGYEDAILKKIPVKKPVLTETVATSGVCEDSAEEGLLLPDKVDRNIGQLEITTSSTAMVDLKGGLEYLVEYPYECLEQKLSRILPLIAAEDLINTFDLSDVKGEELRIFVQEVLKDVPKYQQSSGGFALWVDGDYESPFLSVYAMYALKLAKDAGYEVDEKVMEAGKKYLKELLRFEKDDSRWNYDYSEGVQLTTKSFALYTLYLMGEGEASYIHTLYGKRHDMDIFGRSMLLRAMHIYGKDGEEEKVMIDELMNSIKLSPTTAHFEEREERIVTDKSYRWIYRSDVRTTALLLQTLLEIDADFPDSHKVVKWLTGAQKNGRWNTTQENIFAFLALKTYFTKYEKASPDFSAEVTLDGKKIMEEFFKGRDTGVREKEIPVSEIPVDKNLPLVFDKQGIGRLYYTIRLKYAPTAPRPARDEGLTVFKTIQSLEGDKVEGNKFKAGEVYRVTLSVVTPQERNYVVVEDPVPAGFEVVQESFATENLQILEILGEIRQDESNSWWGYFNHWEKYDDRVLLFADMLYPGEHKFTYFMRAVHYGDFDMPHTKAELMYEPEVFGYSTKEIITVEE